MTENQSGTETERDLEDELAIYDDCFPRVEPTWDEDAIVSPRAFLSEIGYDLDGERIPEQLARFVVEEHSPVKVITLVRSFGNDLESDDPEDVARMVELGGYNAVTLYRFDRTPDEDETIIETFASGGYLVEYSYSRGEDKRQETGHDGRGYYWIDINGRNELLKKLLYGENEGPWADESDDRSYRYNPEWADKPNPAAGETWQVAELVDGQLNKPLGDLAEEHLVDDALRCDSDGRFQHANA